MKNLSTILKGVIIALGIVLFSTISYADKKKDSKKTATVVFAVEMDCMGCVNKLEKNIPYEKGVRNLKVDFKNQKVSITYKVDKTNEENLKKALEKLEFKVKLIES